jgi:hypothetical protein
VCWAFDTAPSRLPIVFWAHSHNDLQTKVRLKIGHEQAKVIQDFQTMAQILSAAFGGGGKSSGSAPSGDVAKPQSVEELQAAMTNVFGMR